MKSNRMNIGWRISLARDADEKREHEKESQQQLADALGVKREVVAYWESGARVPKAEQVAAIARHCNVSADFLLGLTDNTTQDAGIRAVCDYTGLSEDAVIFLHYLKDCSEEEKRTAALIDRVLKEACAHIKEDIPHFTLFSLLDQYITSSSVRRAVDRPYTPSVDDSPETIQRESRADEQAARFVRAESDETGGELMEFARLYREMKMTQIRQLLDAFRDLEEKKKARR